MSLLRSFSFRLAATYAILFVLSLAALFGTYHWVSITAPRNAVEDHVRAESRALAQSYRGGDRTALAASLERRAGQPSPRAAFHLFADPNGRLITTNLPSWPPFTGERWVSVEADVYRDGDEDDYQAFAFDRKLPDGSRLLIGRDVDDLDDLEDATADAALYLVGGTILLALLGGLLMHRAIGRRIDMVGSAARRVMGGDLSGRVRTTGTGDDFDRLAATLNLMLDRVEAGVDAVRRVSDSVAHELRTPLTRLQASLRGLRDAPAGSDPALLNAAIEEADRLQEIFDAVLRIARIESGRHGAQTEPLDMALVLADAIELYGPAADEKRIRLISKVEPDLTVEGDRNLLFQVISNLLDNAIKFTPPAGTISVTGKREFDSVAIEVADTGPGIPADLIDRAGQRFFRAAGSADVPGFGLGLSLAKAIAHLHHSAILLKGGDSGFTVEWRLPRMIKPLGH